LSLKLINRRDLKNYIGDAKKIVDIGSGMRPLKVATTIVDKFPDKFEFNGKTFTENPKGEIKSVDGAEFINADLRDLPFKENEFDFAYCSHVIEHVDDIEHCLKALTKIAPRGYIECPRSWFEYVDASPFHKWYIDYDGTQLVAKKKTDFERDFFLGRRLFDSRKSLFNRFYRNYEANEIVGVDLSKQRLRNTVRRFFSPKNNPTLNDQIENKSYVALCLYWEKDIPVQIVKPSVFV